MSAAFTVAGSAVQGLDYLYLGRKREVMRDQWSFAMEKRDERLAELAKLAKRKS
eukprot:CAMPEP_0195524132 /NCGR_PEP_ID=MMETSP0794_2-20130614/23803_1 /TAXON_ID=515487 /ORGANISM="Stephanopyxis turris, Strain CCMP 815" /LENGTH=53 /DNA_ID=CAMNT_0040654293 /DNA_START=117 /DNA_END=278 /DNA_ORIENTATION=-